MKGGGQVWVLVFWAVGPGLSEKRIQKALWIIAYNVDPGGGSWRWSRHEYEKAPKSVFHVLLHATARPTAHPIVRPTSRSGAGGIGKTQRVPFSSFFECRELDYHSRVLELPPRCNAPDVAPHASIATPADLHGLPCPSRWRSPPRGNIASFPRLLGC